MNKRSYEYKIGTLTEDEINALAVYGWRVIKAEVISWGQFADTPQKAHVMLEREREELAKADELKSRYDIGD